jgi:hypothetical protein
MHCRAPVAKDRLAAAGNGDDDRDTMPLRRDDGTAAATADAPNNHLYNGS